MGMFDNFKDMTKLKQMADDAKKQAENLHATGRSKRGYVSISIDGEKHIKKVAISPEAMNLKPEDLAKHIKDAYRVGAKDIDKQLKKQMKNSNFANMLMGK